MILTFPHHDPTGKYNKVFQNKLPELFKIFSAVCISVTLPTKKQNKLFVEYLRKQGCVIFKNAADTNIGDHMRNALKIATEQATNEKFFIVLSTESCFNSIQNIMTNFCQI